MLNDKLEFAVVLSRELPLKSHGEIVRLARSLMRHGATHARICRQWCNGPWDEETDGKKRDRIRALIERDLNGLPIKPIFSGDPRGTTVKLKLPSQRNNNLGGEGWCVPQS